MNTALPALDPGSIQVYSTPERYCCSPVIANALKDSSQGKSTLIVQLLKGGINQGITSPMRLGEFFAWVRPPLSRRIQNSDISEDERNAIRSLWQQIQIHLQSYQLVLLEEIGLALKWGVISERELMHFIEQKPPQTELILVGTEIPELLRDWADIWTEIKSPISKIAVV